jgi:ligand-binding SRPBCC domain-containing protein
MDYVLERRTLIPADLPTVFAFFKDPANLEAITPPWLQFGVMSASDRTVRDGTRISYRLRWQVFPMRWESLIREYYENECFADEMIRGPYARWYHRHLFRSTAQGVIMTDRVEYRMPLGLLGRIAHRLVVRRQLEEIFDHRTERIAELFGRTESTAA